eukprot:2320891-Rhodomonas_salina.3
MKPVRLTCNHCVCAECAGEWTSNCPKCRASCNQEDVEVDESLLAMAIFYTDLADTVEDAKLTGGNAPANREILDVLEEIHAYTKRVLCGPSQAAPPAAANSVAAAGSRPANGVDEEAGTPPLCSMRSLIRCFAAPFFRWSVALPRWRSDAKKLWRDDG